MDHRIVPAQWEHLQYVADHIRPDDAREIDAAYGLDPFEVIVHSFELSDYCWAAVVDGNPIAVFGVAPHDVVTDAGRPWMIGTTQLDKHRFKFIKGCSGVIAKMLSVYTILGNVVECRNNLNIKWLKHLGFTFGDTIKVGSNSDLFVEFWMVNK